MSHEHSRCLQCRQGQNDKQGPNQTRKRHRTSIPDVTRHFLHPSPSIMIQSSPLLAKGSSSTPSPATNPMARRLLLFLLLCLLSARPSSGDEGSISAVISESGLVFVKDLLVEQAIRTLTPLRLPDIQKSVKIPLVGGVHVSVTNITLASVDVAASTIQTGDSGVVIVASGATANMSMDWSYTYSTWLIPIKISDSGSAFIRVEGMEIGLTISMKNQKGTLALNVTECGFYMKDIFINLDGGASWFYQGFVNAFKDQIISTVENSITKRITEGISKLDLLLQNLPKKIAVDDDVALNVTFVKDPLFENSSVEFDINGLFLPSDNISIPSDLCKNSQTASLCGGSLKMLGISLEVAVFNSLSVVNFQAGKMQWIVSKVPDQSLLNTASWKYIIPQLYRKYPDDDMQLNISLTSPPVIEISPQNIGATIFSDMTVNVLNAGETVPVACISVVVTVSGVVEISGNNLAGKANLNYFTLNLKWSKVGNFHMYLIQGVMRVFLKTVFMPYVNMHLSKGFPLPIIHGFTLQNAYILLSSSRLAVCSDVEFSNYSGVVGFSS